MNTLTLDNGRQIRFRPWLSKMMVFDIVENGLEMSPEDFTAYVQQQAALPNVKQKCETEIEQQKRMVSIDQARLNDIKRDGARPFVDNSGDDDINISINQLRGLNIGGTIDSIRYGCRYQTKRLI